MLGRFETRKDTLQVAVESAFTHVGEIVAIITTAGREVTRELGEWATEVIEMREAAVRADGEREATQRDSALSQERRDAIRDAVAAEHRVD